MAQMRRNLKSIGKKKTAINIARTILGKHQAGSRKK
jgi:hypothetical protein